MSYWLIGIICGNLIIYKTSNILIQGMILLFFLFGIKKDKIKSILFACGFSWSIYHNSPLINGLSSEGVFYKNPSFFYFIKNQLISVTRKEDGKSLVIKTKDPFCLSFNIPHPNISLLQPFPEGFCLDTQKPSFYHEIKNRLSKASKWFQILYLGNFDSLTSIEKKVFFDLGLFHLLVISGFHLSVVSFFLIKIIEALIHGFYSFKIITSAVCYHFKIVTYLFVSCLMFLYISFLGAEPPSQRAFIAFIISCLMPYIFSNYLPIKRKILLVLSLQSFFYPTGFLNFSNGLSWSFYLLGSCFNAFHSLKKLFLLQFIYTLLSFLWFGNMCLLSFLANIFLAPIFLSFFIIIGLSEILGPLKDYGLNLALFFEYLLFYSNEIISNYPFLNQTLIENKKIIFALRILIITSYFSFALMKISFFPKSLKEEAGPS